MVSTAAVVAIWLAVAPAAAQTPAGAPDLDVLLRPVREGGREVTAIEVRSELRRLPAERGPFSVRAPITYASVGGIADAIEELVVRDADGAVPLGRDDDPPDPAGFPYYRYWRAERTVRAPVVIAYRTRMPETVGAGPQFGAVAHAGGFSAAGSGFLVLPVDGSDSLSMRVRWDLSDLAPGSSAISTFGDGAFDLRGPPGLLMQGYYMAGPVGRYPATGTRDGFSAAWLGEPGFDPASEMLWTADAYASLRRFFRDTTDAEFRVFVRVLPGATGNPGTALRNSFMLGTPDRRRADATRAAPRETLVHELVHYWVPALQGGQGAGTWFSEGLPTHYQRLLPLRAGLFSVDEYGASINNTARTYYVSGARNLSADSIRRVGFADPEARRIPYLRGALYFADVDAQIRAASGGRRTLEDVLFPLIARIRAGERIGRDGWVDALVAELGPAAGDQFHAVIVAGETIDPASNAFGPCFERQPIMIHIGETGIAGFEWVRAPGVPDHECRNW